MRSGLAAAGRFAVSVVAVFAVLLVALWVLDTPKIDSFAAADVKRARYPSLTNVSRDEDYSRFRVNSLGLIGDEPAAADEPLLRIAVFGDSFVEAAQVAPQESFLAKLREQLEQSSGRRVEVWNFGFAGDNTGNAFARWVYRPPGRHFDAVIFTFNDGDLFENSPQQVPGHSSSFLMTDANGALSLDRSHLHPPIGTGEYHVKRLFGRLFFALYRIRTRAEEWMVARGAKYRSIFAASQAHAATSEDPAGYAPDQLAGTTFAQLQHVQREIAATGTRCLLVGLPTSRISVPSDKNADPKRREAYLLLSKLLSDAGLPYLDMLPHVEVQVRAGRELYANWEPGGHFNRAGHGVIAQALVDERTDLLNGTTSRSDAAHAVQ